MAEQIIPEYLQRYIAETARLVQSVPRIEPPPGVVNEASRSFRPYIDTLMAASDQVAALIAADAPGWSAAEFEAWATRLRLAMPTAAEVAEADKSLRTQVLPETSREELTEAVTGIADDPGKVELAAFLTKLVEQATGVPGSAPWVVFVLVFCIAVKADSDVVNAIALACAVLALMQASRPGS